MEIRRDDLRGERIAAFLREHLESMHSISPPESVHALSLEGLRAPDITFWSVWEGGELLGCGALKEHDATTGEIKSMRTVVSQRGRGVGSRLVEHILDEARRRGYRKLNLETGSQPEFAPARRLYARYGFVPRGPFGDYVEDPNSVFMTLAL